VSLVLIMIWVLYSVGEKIVHRYVILGITQSLFFLITLGYFFILHFSLQEGEKTKIFTIISFSFGDVSKKLASIMAKRLARRFALARCRVQIPVLPELVWGFFQGFFHTITDKANAGYKYSPLNIPTTFCRHPSSLYPSRIFPSSWLKRRWRASQQSALSRARIKNCKKLKMFRLSANDLINL
jgi:hypothetical protein